MYKVYCGDALDVLRRLPDEYVQCVVTSPPYFGLRSYLPEDSQLKDKEVGFGQTLAEYIHTLVEVFREVRRVLRPDGVFWLNISDSYNGSGGAGGDCYPGGLRECQPKYPGRNISSLKPKDLCGVPWRVAFALQDDGWWLRSDIIWEKGNPMPESVRDRPTKSHEYIFLLTKNKKYFYDNEAIKEPVAESQKERMKYPRYSKKSKGTTGKYAVTNKEYAKSNAKRNKRTVWHINTKPYKGAHFAVFPPELPRPCILAGTSPKACTVCGAPWERIVKKHVGHVPRCKSKSEGRNDCNYGESKSTTLRAEGYYTKTTGWLPTCTCEGNDGSGKCIVLDPFAGSGTTLQVAEELGRDSIGIELNPEYCKLIEERMENLPETEQVPLF